MEDAQTQPSCSNLPGALAHASGLAWAQQSSRLPQSQLASPSHTVTQALDVTGTLSPTGWGQVWLVQMEMAPGQQTCALTVPPCN